MYKISSPDRFGTVSVEVLLCFIYARRAVIILNIRMAQINIFRNVY